MKTEVRLDPMGCQYTRLPDGGTPLLIDDLFSYFLAVLLHTRSFYPGRSDKRRPDTAHRKQNQLLFQYHAMNQTRPAASGYIRCNASKRSSAKLSLLPRAKKSADEKEKAKKSKEAKIRRCRIQIFAVTRRTKQ